MRNTNERGASGWRSSVLWGTGSRGGDSRSNSLTGKGRAILALCLAVCAFVAVLAGTATPAKAAPAQAHVARAGWGSHPTWVDPTLIAKAKQTPGNLVDVIITSTSGSSGADGAVRATGFLGAAEQKLGLIGGVELKLPARFVQFLQRIPGLSVMPNYTVVQSGDVSLTSGVPGTDSTQTWPFTTGNAALWQDDIAQYANSTPAIAVVDSGVSSTDLGSRLIASVNVTSSGLSPSTGDLDGHGTFVANIAAADSPTVSGADPVAPIVSVKALGDQGSGTASDVITACQWILAHQQQYNIKVANFSLHSGYGTNSYNDPLDQAVEQLWFHGITVVAAAGNYGNADGSASGVLFSPGNDPFVITVGALGNNDTVTTSDDNVAPWSAWGYTEDGFAKPEVVAPGRYMVTDLPANSYLASELPTKVLSATQMEISGTSFAAPVVAGTAAEILARHPSWTPDQVKGELMKSARTVPGVAPHQAGVGEITAPWAANDTDPPNPNAGLDQFLTTDANGNPVFNSSAWKTAVQTNASWNDASWNDASWNDASWNDASWNDASWNDASWNDASWNDASWNDFTAQDAAQEDAVLLGG